MKIEIDCKYNIGDHVWYIEDNKVHDGWVRKIDVKEGDPLDSKDEVVKIEGERPGLWRIEQWLKFKVKYGISKDDKNEKKRSSRNDCYEILSKPEELKWFRKHSLFPSKEELLKSL